MHEHFPLCLISETILIFETTSIAHENVENKPNINQIHPAVEQKIEHKFTSESQKVEDALEAETKGIDFKGNVRYFCPKCNVRYIGKA